jgi:hypothetical protein
MSFSQYDVDPHVAEVYDRFEAETDDVELIRKLIAGKGSLRIVEPFCGTGCILIPLALDGHEIAGLDAAATMLDRARAKVAKLHEDVRARITLARCDVLRGDWESLANGGPDIRVWPRTGKNACPTTAAGFDLVLLGGNCFYELSTPEEQEGCIASAAEALKPGGWVYVDNNHMEGELDESWRQPGVKPTRFPAGVCADGARVEGTSETVGFDAAKRLCRARRTITITFPDGRVTRHEYVHQKHPVSFGEVGAWLRSHGFAVEQAFGDRAGNPYARDGSSPRAIFWARKP